MSENNSNYENNNQENDEEHETNQQSNHENNNNEDNIENQNENENKYENSKEHEHYDIDNKESEQENDNNNHSDNEKELETQENRIQENTEANQNQTHLDDHFNDIYSWVDSFQFRKPRNLIRDYSDGINLVEILSKLTKQPLIKAHTVSRTFNRKEKIKNRKLIQKQINKKSYVRITDSHIFDLKPDVIEVLLEKICKCRRNLINHNTMERAQNNYININLDYEKYCVNIFLIIYLFKLIFHIAYCRIKRY
jgi:hypothetical protein